MVFGIKHIKPIFGKFPTTLLALLGFIGSLWFGYHVLTHLPTWDFRAYKVGANIADGMLVPEDAQKAVQEFTWTFNVGGENLEFLTDGSYPTVDGDYVGVETKIIVEAYDPPVKDFSIETVDQDFTAKFLAEDHLVMVVAYSLEKANEEGLKNIKKVTDKAIKNGYTVIGLSASGAEAKQYIKQTYDLNFDFYLCDEKALKTVIRSNPGILKLEKGTVIQKEHFNDAEDLELPKVERKPEPVVLDNIAYFLNDEEVTKAEIDALDPTTIGGMNVLKEGPELEILNSMTSSNYTGLIKITLKE
nr:hypothetical protein [Lacinutrix jangbogonensis]